MSSERTISIVGSEVMPLDYGSMDSESSPSPSSSEKTVEGVRGDEVVEVGGNEVVGVGGNEVVRVGGDSIPITVVEVEGRGERDYDVNAEIMEVKQYRSELRTRDSLGHLVKNYEISSRVLVRPAGIEERACSAPRDHWMPIYSHYLIAGLKFPIPELLVGLLLDYNIGLTQLVPNAMRGGSRRDKGWYYFTPRVANRESRALFTVGPSSIKGWKEKFFFVDDIEWERGDAEVRELASWKAKRANQNSTLSEVEMDQFLNTAGGVAIPKKPRKKSKTSTEQVDEGRARKEVVPVTSAKVEEEVPQLKRKGWEERRALHKKKKVVEEEERGDEGVEVQAPGKGKGLVPTVVSQSSLFEAKNMTGARWFINTTFPEVDKRNVRDEALRYCGASMVKHVLEEFMNSVKERSLLQRQCDQLQKEKEELEKKNKELQESLNKVVPTVKQLEQERSSLSTKLVFEESKRRISESEREAQAKKVKAEYPEVDITKITLGEQEEGVEEDGESMSADFRPQIKLRWEHDANGRAVFPPQFDFEFVAVEEEGAEVEEDEVEAGVEGTEMDESQPVPEVEIHLVPSDDEQPPLPDEQQPTQPPLSAEQEPVEPPPPSEK
ncbi:hypothetical protein SLEP1_g18001 [Rubroshorea leprosula]|uniref:Uncharacterized protein n=1 Tax=Rubroshorea leprosula TaxID=152421 RepID=A0AAV5IZP6_9ROSI|nr:hypothetical protein SLEP1_g18001 [Rubroshorea leprosula]